MTWSFWKTRPCILYLLLAIAAVPSISQNTNATPSREEREVKTAEQAIVASMVVSRSPKGRYRCTQDPLACVGPNQAELGLALLGARASRASLAGLASVSRYQLDGALAEDYHCYVLRDGNRIKPYFASINPDVLSQECQNEVSRFSTGERKEALEGLKVEDICRDPATIKRSIQELTSSIDRGAKCSSEDF